MTFRALVQRAFPYVVVAGVGFGLAYVVVLLFVLPPNSAPPRVGTVLDSVDKAALTPITPESTTPGSVATVPETNGVTPPGDSAAPQSSSPGLPVVIPDLVGMALSDARPVLEGLQLRIILQQDTSSLQPEHTVLRQTPAVGTQIPSGSTVTLIISRFPPIDTAMAPHDPARSDSTTHDPTSHNSARLPSQTISDITHSCA